MKLFIILSMQSLLRLFGAFWIFGGFMTFNAAKQSYFMDSILDSLSSEKEDRLVSYFLFIGSVLTILSGVGLLLTNCWLFFPLSLLIVSQIIYFAIQQKRFETSKTEEEREGARVNPATLNAFKVSLGVLITASLGWAIGALT